MMLRTSKDETTLQNFQDYHSKHRRNRTSAGKYSTIQAAPRDAKRRAPSPKVSFPAEDRGNISNETLHKTCESKPALDSRYNTNDCDTQVSFLGENSHLPTSSASHTLNTAFHQRSRSTADQPNTMASHQKQREEIRNAFLR
jgi:hypothetical protein